MEGTRELARLLRASEDWLVDRVIALGAGHGHAMDTPPLEGAWRRSIVGLTAEMRGGLDAAARGASPPPSGRSDSFGARVARRHRERGVDLDMFLSMAKRYRRAFVELVERQDYDRARERALRHAVSELFDRFELDFVSEWRGTDERSRVDELQEANRRLLNEKNRYQTIFESLSSPVVLVDEAGQVVNLNRAAARAFLGRETPGGHYYDPREAAPAVAWMAAELRDFHAGDELHREYETEATTRDGVRRFQVALTRLLDARDLLRGTVVILADVTELRRAEARLAATVTELERSNAELQQFSYAVAHDVREPLRTISTYLSMLDEDHRERLDDEGRAFVDRSRAATRRLDRLIVDLLAYARVGRAATPPQPIHCTWALAQAEDNLAAAAERSGATFEHGPLPTVLGDPTQLVQLFQNLLGNALEYHRPGVPPRVRVSASSADGFWRVSVQDNGVGIPPRHAQRIFAVFERLDPRRGSDGTGIGLSICQRIVERQGGRIWVESRPGEGATFHFTLPAAPADARPSPEP